MRHIYIRSKRDNRIVAEVEATDKTYQGIIRGMQRSLGRNLKIDDSEFGPSRLSRRQSEDYFLYLLLAIALMAFVVWLLGGGC